MKHGRRRERIHRPLRTLRKKSVHEMWVGLWVGLLSADRPYLSERNGRHEETRTPDLYRVKVAPNLPAIDF